MSQQPAVSEKHKKCAEDIFNIFIRGTSFGPDSIEEYLASSFPTPEAAWRGIDLETVPKNKRVLCLNKWNNHIRELYFWHEEGFHGSWRFAGGMDEGRDAGWEWHFWMEKPPKPQCGGSDNLTNQSD